MDEAGLRIKNRAKWPEEWRLTTMYYIYGTYYLLVRLCTTYWMYVVLTKSWVLTSARLWHWLWVRGLWRSCCLPGTPGRSMGAWQRRRPRWWGGSDGTDAGCQPTRGCSASAWLQPVTLPPTSSTTLKNNSKSSPSGRGLSFHPEKRGNKNLIKRDVIKTWTSWMCWKTIGHIFPGLFTFMY